MTAKVIPFNNNSRFLKVTSKSIFRSSKFIGCSYYKNVPWINLSGVWLQNAGFNTGDTISISIEENCLIISKAN
ncbi:SymE family type I addiction module toxin [Filimonas effusa]|uniref:Type I addiction module toxin, SymE family n=1 Tax=Filimonas effusa TaxID=2508721 RepID=A0A4Q1D239_9BACT|nr:type I addiction module toxin, SymE family [Filimonas effusa]